MSKGRILFADNVKRFLKVRSEFLESEGYEVVTASTFEEAQQVLRDQWIHLAILDIRLVNDNDDLDISGLTLAREQAFRAVPKIMLTGFPSVDAVRVALMPEVDSLPPAVNFVSKQEGAEALVRAVERAFEQYVRINRDLEIRWDQREHSSFLHLISLVQSNLPGNMLVQRAEELEDLFRRLFYDYRQIWIDRLLWHDGGRFCLSVLARSPQGAVDPRFLICGDRECLKNEQGKLQRLAPQFFQGTVLAAAAETTHFGASACELPGTNIETVQTLRDLYQTGRERPLKTAFAHLLEGVLKAWHQHGQVLHQTRDLMALYRQWAGLSDDPISRLEDEQRIGSLIQAMHAFEGIKLKRGDGVAIFDFPRQPPRHFPDPVVTVYAPLAKYDSPITCRISPGRLTAENVLVDARQNTWLTDFAFADQAPQWWDFICLEAALRFDLSQAPDVLAWQEFEECLVTPGRLDERLEQTGVIPELRTAVALIEQVRRQAASETGLEPLPYYAGLLVWIVKAMTAYDPGVLYTRADWVRGAHLLLAAAMIAERLGAATEDPQQAGPLRLDEDGKVWIGDRPVAVLGGYRLKILRCLFEQAGRVVSNRAIAEGAYGEPYDASDHNQSQRIRQEIRRLREEIEPDLERPRYIVTERERGYRLQPDGKPQG